MDKAKSWQRILTRTLLIALLFGLSGCALLVPEAPPEEPAAVPEPAPAPVPVARDEQPAEPEPAPVVVTPPAPETVTSPVAVVLTGSLPAYTTVADELARWLDDYSVYDLDGRGRSPRQVFSAIADSQAELVVAIGLGAAKAARTFATVPVVFSQVFNVRENGLIADSLRGVEVLPPMALHIEAWRGMDPKITNIGAILGEGHEELIAEAERAMEKRGIRFHYAVAKSDRETLYHFKRLIRGLDGFILFPDNRILSRDVFTEIMSDAARHRVQVAVFNESLLKHGATFSASAVESNIADKITITLNAIEKGKLDEVAPLTPLSDIRIRTNPAMVRIFGLDVSAVEIGNSVAEAQ